MCFPGMGASPPTARPVALKPQSDVTSKTRVNMNRSSAVLLAALLLPGTGCSYYHSRSLTYLGAPRPAPTDAAQIEIIHSPPTRPHDPLGEIVVDASIDPSPKAEKLEARFRREGARMGADAVFIVQDQSQPTGWWVGGPWWSPSVSTVEARIIVGVALRYQPAPTPGR